MFRRTKYYQEYLGAININVTMVCLFFFLLFCRYSDIPQVHRAPPTAVEGGRKPRGTIGQYFATMHCPVCEQLTVEGVCPQCRRDPAKVATTLSVRMKEAEAKCSDIESVSYDPSIVLPIV